MRRYAILLALPLCLLLAACSGGNKHKNNGPTISSGTPPVQLAPPLTPLPTVTPSTLKPLPAASATGTGRLLPPATASSTAATASGTASATATTIPPPAASATAAPTSTRAPATAVPTATGSLVPPPPPPPPVPPSSARGSDSSGVTAPVGDLCPLGYPVKGDSAQKAYQPSDSGYDAVKPVACFATIADATVAGYTPVKPVG